MKWIIRSLVQWLSQEVHKQYAILLPLRLFIGLGWLRASVEKLVEPDWYSGVALEHYFYECVANGDVAFPFYQLLMEGLFSAHAPMLSKLVMIGELYCGIAILLGLLTRPALLAGIFMNLNFVLAGSINPSAFYIVIQLVLVASTVGQVFGLDSILVSTNPFALTSPRKRWLLEKAKMVLYLGGSLASVLLLIPVATQIDSIDPAHSVEDPAMLLLILLGLQSLLLLILSGQAAQRGRSLREGVDRSIRQHPIPEYAVKISDCGWAQIVRVQNHAKFSAQYSVQTEKPTLLAHLLVHNTKIQFVGYTVGNLILAAHAIVTEPVSRYGFNIETLATVVLLMGTICAWQYCPKRYPYMLMYNGVLIFLGGLLFVIAGYRFTGFSMALASLETTRGGLAKLQELNTQRMLQGNGLTWQSRSAAQWGTYLLGWYVVPIQKLSSQFRTVGRFLDERPFLIGPAIQMPARIVFISTMILIGNWVGVIVGLFWILGDTGLALNDRGFKTLVMNMVLHSDTSVATENVQPAIAALTHQSRNNILFGRISE